MLKKYSMKKIFLTILAAAAVLTGCKEKVIYNDVNGHLSLKIDWSDEYTERPVVTKSGETVDINDFIITITKASGDVLMSTTYAEMPSMLSMVPGEYTISATSPVAAASGFGSPLYGAEKSFSVVRDAVSNIDLVCSLYNVKVSFELSKKFVDEVVDYNIKVYTGTESYTWESSDMETGADGTAVSISSGYFDPADVMTIQVVGYHKADITAEPAEITKEIDNVKARDHVIFKLDAKVTGTLETGENGLSVDEATNDLTVDVEVPGFDETPVERPENPDPVDPVEPEEPSDAPTMEWPANPTFATVDIEEGMDVNLTIKAPNGIKSFVVKVSDNFAGMVDAMGAENGEMDLIGNEELIGNLGSMLPTGDELLDETEVLFSLSTLVPLIAQVGTPGEDYVFTLKVGDPKSQFLEKSLTFHNPEK